MSGTINTAVTSAILQQPVQWEQGGGGRKGKYGLPITILLRSSLTTMAPGLPGCWDE